MAELAGIEMPSLVRLRTVCSPALTGATVAWGLLVMASSNSELMFAAPLSLRLIWAITLGLGVLLSFARKLPVFTASTLSALFGTSLALTYYSVMQSASQNTGTGDTPADIAPLHILMYLVVVATAGLIWIPLVFLNSRRHRLHAEAAQGAPAHA